jgi:hypothetical protein
MSLGESSSSPVKKKVRSPHKSSIVVNGKYPEPIKGPALLSKVYEKYELSKNQTEFFDQYTQSELDDILSGTIEEKYELEICIKKILNFMKSLKSFSLWKQKRLRGDPNLEENIITDAPIHTTDF